MIIPLIKAFIPFCASVSRSDFAAFQASHTSHLYASRAGILSRLEIIILSLTIDQLLLPNSSSHYPTPTDPQTLNSPQSLKMRILPLLPLIQTTTAFNIFPNFFQTNLFRSQVYQNQEPPQCSIYTIIQYPCKISTWIPSNTVLSTCSTIITVSNAPTELSTVVTSTTTLGVVKPTTTVCYRTETEVRTVTVAKRRGTGGVDGLVTLVVETAVPCGIDGSVMIEL